MIIVNDPKNMPVTIPQLNRSKFKGHLTEAFLNETALVNGVIKNNYWMIRIEGVFRYPTRTIETEIISRLINWCAGRGYKNLMIINK